MPEIDQIEKIVHQYDCFRSVKVTFVQCDYNSFMFYFEDKENGIEFATLDFKKTF